MMLKNYVSPHDADYEYRRWLEDRVIQVPPMTNTQYKFAKMLFEEENFKLTGGTISHTNANISKAISLYLLYPILLKLIIIITIHLIISPP